MPHKLLQNTRSKQSIVGEQRDYYRLYDLKTSSPRIDFSPSSSHLNVKENYSFLFTVSKF